MILIIQKMKLIQEGMLALNKFIHQDRFKLAEFVAPCLGMTDLNYIEGLGCAIVDYTKSVKDVIETPFADAAVENVKTTYAAVTSAIEPFSSDDPNEVYPFDPRRICDLERLGNISDAMVACTTLWCSWSKDIRNAYDAPSMIDAIWNVMLSFFGAIQKTTGHDIIPPDENALKIFPFEVKFLPKQKYFSEEELKSIHEAEIAKRNAAAEAKAQAELAEKNKEYIATIIECVGKDNFEAHKNGVDPKYAQGVSIILTELRKIAEKDNKKITDIWNESLIFYSFVGAVESDFFYAMILMNAITKNDYTLKNLDMMKVYDHPCADPVPTNSCISTVS